MQHRTRASALAEWFSEDRSGIKSIQDMSQPERCLWIESGRPLLADQQPRETDAERAMQMEVWLNDRIERHLAVFSDAVGMAMGEYVSRRLGEFERSINRQMRVIDGDPIDLPPLPKPPGRDVDPEAVGRAVAAQIDAPLKQFLAGQLERLVGELVVSKKQ